MIGLQIDGKWAVLDEDVSISIEEQSPVWGEGNSYSFPFELSVEENRHIIGNSDQLTGQSVYDVLHGRSAVLYVQGIPFFYGKISIEDEIEIADGRIELNLVSGNKTFEDMIDGMNCQDVPLMDEIVVGESFQNADIQVFVNKEDETHSGKLDINLPSTMMVMEVNGVSTVNVDKPYPQKAYCNTRICYQLPEKDDDVDKEDRNGNIAKTIAAYGFEVPIVGKYVSLDAERPLSGLCFYVLYFFESLFKHLGLIFDMSTMTAIEDMNRLAFFNTKCDFVDGDITRTKTLYIQKKLQFGVATPLTQRKEYWNNYDYIDMELSKTDGVFKKFGLELQARECIATSKNFPNTDVSEVVDAMKSGFGVRFIFNKEYTKGKAIFLKDILRNKEIVTIAADEIYSADKVENFIRGFALTYQGDDEDTSYNYNEWDNSISTTDYGEVAASVNPFNKHLYIDTNLGNAYRVKIDDDATSEDTMYPSLYEVGAFNKATYGDCSVEERIETVEIGFSPIILNDVNGKVSRDTRRAVSGEFTGTQSQLLSVFVDAAMKYPGFEDWIKVGGWFVGPNRELSQVELKYRFRTLQRFDFTHTDQSLKALNERNKDRAKWTNGITPLAFEQDSPIAEIDTGLTLGIMRGPGNEAGVEEFDEDYDGEGNVKYVTVPSDYAFSSDTCDNYGNLFDYNGIEEGGVDLTGRFSLKLRAEKPVGEGGALQQLPTNYAKRGLFDKFYTEYAYFVTHRKIVKLTLRMELADLVGIDWTKRYKVGQYVGFINKVSYSVGQDGLGDVEMEMYYV